MIKSIVSKWKLMDEDQRDFVIGVSLITIGVTGMTGLCMYILKNATVPVRMAELHENGDLIIRFANGATQLLKRVPE